MDVTNTLITLIVIINVILIGTGKRRLKMTLNNKCKRKKKLTKEQEIRVKAWLDMNGTIPKSFSDKYKIVRSDDISR